MHVSYQRILRTCFNLVLKPITAPKLWFPAKLTHTLVMISYSVM